jgi:hypothetical protein
LFCQCASASSSSTTRRRPALPGPLPLRLREDSSEFTPRPRTAPKPHLCGRCFACVRERAVRISPACPPFRGAVGASGGPAGCRLRARLGGQHGTKPPLPSSPPRRAAAEGTSPVFPRILGRVSHGGFDHILRVARSRPRFPLWRRPLRAFRVFSGRWERGGGGLCVKEEATFSPAG